jgi:excisionase family DNA binding protein
MAQDTTFHTQADTDWLTAREAARVVRLGLRTIYHECARGRIRCAHVGGRRTIRIRRTALYDWLESLCR